MARSKSEIPVTQSLLDRLRLEVEHPFTHEISKQLPSTRSASVQLYKNGVKRDVEWLLNSRRGYDPEVEDYPLTANSVSTYGLQDISELGQGSDRTERVLEGVRQTLKIHEPRIRDARVTLVREDVLKRSVRFHVEGMLWLENSEEMISFDTLLDVTSGKFGDLAQG